MNRRGNIVLAMAPDDSSIFNKLDLVSEASVQAGCGRLVFIRNLVVDEESVRYEFLLESRKAELLLHDDFDLGLRYISVRGEQLAVELLTGLVEANLAPYSLDELLRLVEQHAEERPEWLNGLALASDSPAPSRVVRAITERLNSQIERIALRAVEAAFLVGVDQFSRELDRLKIQGLPAIRKMLSLLRY